MKKNDFSKILESYFLKHLSLERRFSDNTYATYLMVLKQFIGYMTEYKKLRYQEISIHSFSKSNILDFLEYVEKERNVSIRTRNHKLAVINSFLEYVQSVDPVYLDVYLQAKSIKLKRVKKEKMDYLTREELEAIMRAIDIKTKSGYKHYVLLAFLYESGMRVSELIELETKNLFFDGSSPFIKVLGKGNKERIVYLNDEVVAMVKGYLERFKIKAGPVFLNPSGKKMTRFSVNKLISKYYDMAKESCPTLNRKTITPHSFRHSKAVHLLMNDTALPIIQRFLGHASIQTTEIYLDITNDEVARSVKTAASLIDPESKAQAIWQGDDKLIELLEKLGE